MVMVEPDLLAETVLSLPSEPTPASFDSYVKRVKEKVDPTTYLGFLCWYHVPNACQSTYIDYKALIEETQAPVRFTASPKPTNVFRRGCTKAQGDWKKVPSGNPDIFYNYVIHETGKDDRKLYRAIVRTEVDFEGHELSFVELGKLTFTRDTTVVQSEPTVQGLTDGAYQDIVDQIKQYVKDHAQTVTAYMIRESIRQAIDGPLIQAVRCNPNGGVYFVSREKADVLAKIEHLCDKLDIHFSLPPLLDDGVQRNMLRNAFRDESVGKLEELSVECLELLESDKAITDDQWTKLRMAFVDQKSRAKAYSALLDDALDESEVHLDIVNRQIMKLREKVAA